MIREQMPARNDGQHTGFYVGEEFDNMKYIGNYWNIMTFDIKHLNIVQNADECSCFEQY